MSKEHPSTKWQRADEHWHNSQRRATETEKELLEEITLLRWELELMIIRVKELMK